MDRRAWWATVHGVAKSRTRLSDFTFTLFIKCIIERDLFSFSDISCQYKEMQQSFVTLYPAALLNSFISSNSFYVESLAFSIQNIILSASNDSFTSFLPVWIPFVSFSCLIAVAQASKICQIEEVREHPCLVPYFTGKASSFSLLSTMLTVGLS